MPVGGTALPDLPHERHDGVGFLAQTDVEEARPGDDDVPYPGEPKEMGPQHLGDLERRQPGRPSEPQSDVGGEVPAPAGSRLPTTTRSGTGTTSSPASTARRTADNTVRESSTGVTGQA